MAKTKLFSIEPTAVQKFMDHVAVGQICSCTTATYSIYSPLSVTPVPLLEKSVSVTVAVSGVPQENIVWAAVMTHRVDVTPHQPGKLELQADSALLLFCGEGMLPVATGVVAYHQCFPGQNVALPQYTNMSSQDATLVMRNAIRDLEKRDLSFADPQVKSVLDGMVQRHGEKLLRLL